MAKIPVIDLTDPTNANWRDIERATGKPLPGPNVGFMLTPVDVVPTKRVTTAVVVKKNKKK